MLQQPELLAPAGSLETLKYAVMYGADAVYCALPEFGMRAAPVNLTVGELHEGCIFAHARGKKVYLTLNTLPTNEELSKLPRYIQDAAEAGVDAFIIADLGVLALAKKYAPQVERHVSTQAGITNYEAAKVCYELGAKRVVLARELPLTEIAQIRDNCPQDLELEAFVHGAMCMSVSGRCLLSNYMTGRDSNRGACAQPCRLPYGVNEKAAGGHPLSLKDANLADYVQELEQMGVACLKLEGRMKRPEYVAAAVTACKKSLAGESAAEYEHTLGAIFSRSGFTSGYYNGALGRDMFGVRRKEDVTAAKDVLSPLAALYDGEQPLIRADMHLSAQVGEKAYLAVKAAGKSVFAESENAVQKAQNRAVGSEEIETRLRKCGSTQFYAGDVGTDIGDDIFLSASEINSLRRKALAMLEEKIAERSEIPFYPQEISIRRRRSQNRGYVIRVRSISQIPSDLSYVRRVILPMGVGEETVKYLKDKKIQPAVEVPAAIFGGDDAVYNSLVKARKNGISLAAVCSLDGAAIAKKAGMKLCALPGTNIFNTISLDEFAHLGFTDAILSTELKIAQCASLGGKLPRGVFAYGRLPLMQTRNCPVKNGTTCDKCRKHGFLTDRMGVTFPVECTPFASTLLNSVPIVESDKREQFEFADFSLLWFTTETKEECEKVLESYRRGDAPQGEFTRGLLYRGVE